MDLSNLTFVGLVVVGAVNVISFYKKDLKPQQKVAIGAVVAFVAGFVPPVFASEIATRIKDAIVVAIATSGAYRLFQKAGGE